MYKYGVLNSIWLTFIALTLLWSISYSLRMFSTMKVTNPIPSTCSCFQEQRASIYGSRGSLVRIWNIQRILLVIARPDTPVFISNLWQLVHVSMARLYKDACVSYRVQEGGLEAPGCWWELLLGLWSWTRHTGVVELRETQEIFPRQICLRAPELNWNLVWNLIQDDISKYTFNKNVCLILCEGVMDITEPCSANESPTTWEGFL